MDEVINVFAFLGFLLVFSISVFSFLTWKEKMDDKYEDLTLSSRILPPLRCEMN